MSPYHRSADRSAGLVLIGVFVLGLLGAIIALLLNHGDLPAQFAAKVSQATRSSSPL